MNKNYNYQRKKLILPEYGRHIQQIVDHLITITDREQRSASAHAVIAVMGNINPVLRDSVDFNHKLWDHLFVISDFKLDVDSPYPTPVAETIAPRPQKMPYPQKRVSMKYYGRNIENVIRSLTNVDNAKAVNESVVNITRFMRTKSYEFNQEHPSNDVIIKDIRRMSNNMIDIDEVAIGNIKSDYKGGVSSHTKSSYKSNKPVKNGKTTYRKRGVQ